METAGTDGCELGVAVGATQSRYPRRLVNRVLQTRIEKWGNRLGTRSPRGLAEQVGLESVRVFFGHP